MAEKNKIKEPPVFLSTHPSSKKIENLSNWINEVIIKYPPIKVYSVLVSPDGSTSTPSLKGGALPTELRALKDCSFILIK